MMMLHHLSANDRYERNRHLTAHQQRTAVAAAAAAAAKQFCLLIPQPSYSS